MITFGWDLCYTCNYRCPYCGVWNKDSKDSLILTAEEWRDVWNRIYDKYGSCHIYMSGGEPATYPYFYELVKKLTEKHYVEICTNLSWDIYKLIPEIPSGILKIAPTFHPSFADFEDFFNRVIKIKGYLPNSQIYYVAYPDQIKEMSDRSKKLKEHKISLVPMPLRNGGYVLNSEEEKQVVENLSPYKDKGVRLEYQLKNISPKDKLCRSGQHYAVIRANGLVDRCSQYSTGGLGSLLDKNFKLLDNPLPCEKEYCPIESQWILE